MTATQLKQNYSLGIFTTQADYFEQTAAAYQRVADSKGYRRNLPARAAIMREVTHYLECAARLRGVPVMKLQTRKGKA